MRAFFAERLGLTNASEPSCSSNKSLRTIGSAKSCAFCAVVTYGSRTARRLSCAARCPLSEHLTFSASSLTDRSQGSVSLRFKIRIVLFPRLLSIGFPQAFLISWFNAPDPSLWNRAPPQTRLIEDSASRSIHSPDRRCKPPHHAPAHQNRPICVPGSAAFWRNFGNSTTMRRRSPVWANK